MTADDYRATLAALGLSQARLSRLLKVDKATPNRWALETAPIPRAVELLLRALASGRLTVEDLEALP